MDTFLQGPIPNDARFSGCQSCQQLFRQQLLPENKVGGGPMELPVRAEGHQSRPIVMDGLLEVIGPLGIQTGGLDQPLRTAWMASSWWRRLASHVDQSEEPDRIWT